MREGCYVDRIYNDVFIVGQGKMYGKGWSQKLDLGAACFLTINCIYLGEL